jgi:hypothetical protein
VLLLATGAGIAAPERDQWHGPQVIDADRRASLMGLVANAEGVFAVWLGGGKLRVAHREPAPDAAWTTPRPLEGSANNLLETGPVMALASGAAVVFATVAAAERTYIWRISADGVPGTPRQFPSRLFTPSTADLSANDRWLVAGTRSDVPGPVYAAVRSASGAWRVSKELPMPGGGELVGAWFDRAGVPHVMAVEPVPDSKAGTGDGRAVVEATLRPDGTWTSPRRIATTIDDYTLGSPYVVANRDGDVTLSYVPNTAAPRTATAVKTRPFGGTWHPSVRFPQETPALAIDERGRTFIVRAGGEVFAGRIGPLGVLDRWQQLTDVSFDNDVVGRLDVTISRDGDAVVGVIGHASGAEVTSRVERYFRCLPGQPCTTTVGDFDASESGGRDLVTGSAGAVWMVSSYTSRCDGAVLCSWRLPPSS